MNAPVTFSPQLHFGDRGGNCRGAASTQGEPRRKALCYTSKDDTSAVKVKISDRLRMSLAIYRPCMLGLNSMNLALCSLGNFEEIEPDTLDKTNGKLDELSAWLVGTTNSSAV